MKIAMETGRLARLAGVGLAVLAVSSTSMRPAMAQDDINSKFRVPPAPRHDPNAKPAQSGQMMDLRNSFQDVPGLQRKALPVSPNEAIAIVNKQPITRQQLADECVAKEGKKVLDTIINRLLIEQALAKKNMTVTAAEIDQEIDSIAARFGFTREVWLRALDKERNISPAQYAREIVYPAIALRKLCSDRVVVTPRDWKEAFESMYGEKLKVRMILVNNQQKAIAIWEQLHNNPGGFEKVAMDQSQDPSTRAQGGLVLQPITRHAHPKNVSDAAFRQLVDGDPDDKDKTHKPKDGDITGPIQMDEAAWLILQREELIPANKNANPKDEQIRKQTYDMIYEVKLKEAMEDFYQQVIKEAEIENRLTGAIKLANEETKPAHSVDGDVRLMGKKDSDDATPTHAVAAPSSKKPKVLPRPAALSKEVAEQQFRPLKPGGDPAPKAAKTAPGTATTSKPAAAPANGGQ